MSVKYPNVTVRLAGTDGNAFALMGEVTKALRNAGVSHDERNEFITEATAGDYNALLQTIMRWVNVR